MRPKRKIIISLILLFAGFHLHAQDSTLIGKTINWDLVKCIDYAKKNNIQINSLRLSALTSQQQYLLAKASRLPNLSGSASQNFEHANTNGGNSNNNSFTSGGTGSGFTASGAYSLNSSVTLYNGNLINN